MKTMIIRGQTFYHDPVTVTGNVEALTRLRDQLTAAIEGSDPDGFYATDHDFCPPDGEGFCVNVFVNNDDWQDRSWQEEASWYAMHSQWQKDDQ